MMLLIMIAFRALLEKFKCTINTMVSCLNVTSHPVFIKKKVVIRIIVEISTVIELIKIQNVKVRKDSKSFSVISLRKRLPGSRSRCSTH